MEEGWAKVSERVVEVVTEEVFQFFIHFESLLECFLMFFSSILGDGEGEKQGG